MMTKKDPSLPRFVKTNITRSVSRFALSLVAMVAAPLALATPILDQSVIYPSSGGISSYTIYETPTNEYVLAQTFTAGLTGRLTGVDLALTDKATQDLTVSILHTNAGLPDTSAPALATETLTPGDVDLDPFSLESVDFTSTWVDLYAGNMYTIMLSSTTPFNAEYDWTRGSFDTFTGNPLSPQDPYAGGAGYYSNDGGSSWSALSGFSEDFSFQTYIDPTLVPEPSSIPIFATAFILLGWVRRRKKARDVV